MKKALSVLLFIAALALPCFASAAVIPWADVVLAFTNPPNEYTIAAGDEVTIPPGTVWPPPYMHSGNLIVRGKLIVEEEVHLNRVTVEDGGVVICSDILRTDGLTVLPTALIYGTSAIYPRLQLVFTPYLDFNGGSVPGISALGINVQSPDISTGVIPAMFTPTRAGYTFMGWEPAGLGARALWSSTQGPGTLKPGSSLPRTGDSFPFGELAGAAAGLAGAAGVLLRRMRRAKRG